MWENKNLCEKKEREYQQKEIIFILIKKFKKFGINCQLVVKAKLF
jgi:hypothetical protein